MPKPPPTPAGALSTSSLPKEGSFAYRQMIKMGWKPDTGLGKDQSGITSAITVSRRREGQAIGGGGDRGQEVGYSVRLSGFLCPCFPLAFITPSCPLLTPPLAGMEGQERRGRAQ